MSDVGAGLQDAILTSPDRRVQTTLRYQRYLPRTPLCRPRPYPRMVAGYHLRDRAGCRDDRRLVRLLHSSLLAVELFKVKGIERGLCGTASMLTGQSSVSPFVLGRALVHPRLRLGSGFDHHHYQHRQGQCPFRLYEYLLLFNQRSSIDSRSNIIGPRSTLLILQVTVGRPRPDLFGRCDLPDDLTENPIHGLTSWTACQRTDLLQDGFRSFPSGHSSFAWAGMWYFILYLCASTSYSTYLFHRRRVQTQNQ